MDKSTPPRRCSHTETVGRGRSLQNVPPDDRPSVSGAMRRAVDGALDATVGRVGHSVSEAAREATTATAHQIIEELEPYLIEEAVPRIVAGIQPYLTEQVVPEVMDGVSDHLAAVTVPRVVDGVTDHLVTVTVPRVVEGVSPRLTEAILPGILDDLRPYLEQTLVPAILDAVLPRIRDDVAPDLVDALMPKIRDEVAPDLVDALMPKIRDEVAPQLVEALLPQIRQEVVPQIMDDIVEDPRVRDLIREQSQGLLLDALEGFRATLANLDDLVDRIGRGLMRRPARPRPETAVDLVLSEEPQDSRRPIRMTMDELAAQRALWRTLPVPPAPAGRRFTYAGVVTRLLGLGLDLAVVGFVNAQVFNTLFNVLQSLFGDLSSTATGILLLLAAATVPVYLGLCTWVFGRTLGMAVVGVRVCTPDGNRPHFVRAVLRGWLGLLALVIWLITGVVSFFDTKRRSLLDMLLHTEVRYSVPETQQRRHLRDAVLEQRQEKRRATTGDHEE